VDDETAMQKTLFWSRRGEIACAKHAPAAESPRWIAEGWEGVAASDTRRITYQCQHCGAGPIARPGRATAAAPLILNVDDRPASLYARDRVLRLHGFTVANADSGRSALDVARQLQPHLILLDVHLGDVDGRELCRDVKADAALGHIPVLLISSTLNNAATHETVRMSRADGFIAEPVAPDVLAGTIRKVLEGVA
jgi:CheY-like chemotaxis protein